MAVQKCLECKYFEEGRATLGNCKLHTRKVFPDDHCRDFTNKSEELKKCLESVILLDNKLDALEDKVKRLDEILSNLL